VTNNSLQEAALQKRIEKRTPIESMVMPFLGSRTEDSSPFQYLVQDLSPHGAKIVLPKWVLKRELLRVGDMVDFHLPFIFDGEAYAAGEIVWAKFDDELDAQACGVRIDERAPTYYPVSLSFEDLGVGVDLTAFKTSENLLDRVLKDSILLKKGILIYLKHLKPMAARILDAEAEDIAEMRAFFFDDTTDCVRSNIEKLERLRDEMRDAACSGDKAAACFDLEDLRSAMEPEIVPNVWTVAFDQEMMSQYINAINQLERRLFYNYNTIVMLYMSFMD